MPSVEPVGRRRSASRVDAPRRSPRATPAAATSRARCRAGSRARRPSAPTYCESRLPAASTSSDVADAGGRARRRRRRSRRRTPPPKTAHAERVPQRAVVQRAAATGPYHRSHAARRSADEPVADAGRPAPPCRAARWCRARTGGAPRRSCGATALLDARARRRAASVDVEHGRQREQRRAARAPGGPSTSSTTRDAEPEDPAERREQRHEQVVEREHLVAQHREPVEVLGPLVVLDRRRPTPAACATCASSAIVDPVAEAALHPVADDTAGTSVAVADDAEADRRDDDHASRSSSSTPSASSFSHSASSASGSAVNSVSAERQRPAAAARRGSRA